MTKNRGQRAIKYHDVCLLEEGMPSAVWPASWIASRTCRRLSSVQCSNSRTKPSVSGIPIDALMPELRDFNARQRERCAKYLELQIAREMVCQPRRQAADGIGTACNVGACRKTGHLHSNLLVRKISRKDLLELLMYGVARARRRNHDVTLVQKWLKLRQ